MAKQFSDLFLDTQDINIKEVESKLNKSDLIYFDEQVSMLERTAHKYYPIILEVVKKMVKHKDLTGTKDEKYQSKFVREKI